MMKKLGSLVSSMASNSVKIWLNMDTDSFISIQWILRDQSLISSRVWISLTLINHYHSRSHHSSKEPRKRLDPSSGPLSLKATLQRPKNGMSSPMVDGVCLVPQPSLSLSPTFPCQRQSVSTMMKRRRFGEIRLKNTNKLHKFSSIIWLEKSRSSHSLRDHSSLRPRSFWNL